MIIRKIASEDIFQLQVIAKQTFFDTFSAGNTAENLNKFLSEEFTTEKLAAEIENPNSEFFFVEDANDVYGYLKLNFDDAQTEIRDPNAVEIERIYVLKEFHGKKVGQILFEKALEISRKRNAEYIWLGVWENNARAINFYKKNGFAEFDKHFFQFGYEEQTDVMMKLQLAATL